MRLVNPSISVVTPFYNDGVAGISILQRLEADLIRSGFPWEIVIIDDGSKPAELSLVKKYASKRKRYRLYIHEFNQGIAITYRQLYTSAKNDFIVLFSVGGEWDPADVVRLIKQQVVDKADIVIGVRSHKAYPFSRAAVSFFYNALTYLIFGVATEDAGSIKLIRRKLVRDIPIISKGVFDEAERIVRAKRMGYRIVTVPVSHIATDKLSASTPKWPLVGQAMWDMLKVRFSYFL